MGYIPRAIESLIIPENIVKRAPVVLSRPSSSSPMLQPIHQAVQDGNQRSVEFPLKSYPDCVKAVGENDITPLLVPSDKGFAFVVDMSRGYVVLNTFPTQINNFAKDGRMSLHQAVQNAYLAVFKKLFEHGVDMDGWLLWIPPQPGRHDIVKMLLETGAASDVASKMDERRPMRLAGQHGYTEIVKLRLKAVVYARPRMHTSNDEVLPAQNGNTAITKLIATYITNFEFETGVHQATQSGRTDFVRFLLSHKGHVDSHEKDG